MKINKNRSTAVMIFFIGSLSACLAQKPNEELLERAFKKLKQEILSDDTAALVNRITFPLDEYSADAFDVSEPISHGKRYELTKDLFRQNFNHFFREEFKDSVRTGKVRIYLGDSIYTFHWKSHNQDYIIYNMKGTCDHKIWCIYEKGTLRIKGFFRNCYGEG